MRLSLQGEAGLPGIKLFAYAASHFDLRQIGKRRQVQLAAGALMQTW